VSDQPSVGNVWFIVGKGNLVHEEVSDRREIVLLIGGRIKIRRYSYLILGQEARQPSQHMHVLHQRCHPGCRSKLTCALTEIRSEPLYSSALNEKGDILSHCDDAIRDQIQRMWDPKFSFGQVVMSETLACTV
jgi:hypothetical protein